jgi:hypothetical protein
MSRARANWHFADLVLPAGDPMQQIAELKSTAKVIDVGRDAAAIHADLKTSLVKEGRYDGIGITCSIKSESTGRTPCDECPYYTEDVEDDPRGLLCMLGRRQNRLLDELHALQAVDRLDDALVLAYQDDQAAGVELVAALA